MIAIQTTSPRIGSLLFLNRALFAKVCHPNLQRFVWKRHVGAIRMGTNSGGLKPTETNVTEFCYKSVNLSLEELKKPLNNTFLSTRTRSDSQISRESPEISHFLTNSAVM